MESCVCGHTNHRWCCLNRLLLHCNSNVATSRDAFSQTCNTDEKMWSEPDCWLKFGFWSKSTVQTAAWTRQRCNRTFHAGLLMQGKRTFSTLSDIPNRSKERLLPSELSETHWQASALCVMMFNASGQSPPSETRGAISSCLSPRGRYFRCIDSSDDQSLGLSSAVPGGCWRRHLAPLFV